MEEDELAELLDESKYDHVSFVDLHIFIPKGNLRGKYSIEKIKKLLDVYDEYVYQLEKIEQKKIISDEEKENTIQFIESVKKQKEVEIGTYVENRRV